MNQQYDLYRAIPSKFIHQAPQGKQGSYIPHWVIQQAIVAAVGQFSWELAQVSEQDLPAHKEHPELPGAVTGAVYRMTVTVDGHRIVIEEPGSCDAGAWERNNAERLKKASSDALKRCAMRLGVGLHLWCKTPDEFFLPAVLRDQSKSPLGDDAVFGVEETGE